MKKFLLTLLMVLLLCGQVWATTYTGTPPVITETLLGTFLNGTMQLIKVHSVSGTTDYAGYIYATPNSGAVTTWAPASAYTLTKITGGYVTQVIVDPGATPPTTLYDITLVDTTGTDVMGGVLSDLSTTVTKSVVPYYSDLGVYGDKPFTNNLILNVTNSTAASAIIDIYLFIRIK